MTSPQRDSSQDLATRDPTRDRVEGSFGPPAKKEAAAEKEASSLVGRTIGPCLVTGTLGEGGGGRVYRAIHLRLGNEVALKVTHKRRRLDRFKLEATLAAQLSHPNIVRVLDCDFDPDAELYFIVQELVDGNSLEDRVTRTGPLSVSETVEMALGLVSALRAVHAAGAVHRDLKPANVLLTSEGVAKLIDFGIAKILTSDGDTDMTRQGALIGTPTYMAPEQAGSKQGIGPATDFYALGAILHFALTGRPPLVPSPKESLLEFVSRLLSSKNEVFDPRAFRAELPQELAELVASLLSWKPEQRPNADRCERVLRDLLQPSRPTPKPTTGLHGTFSELPLTEILQTIEFNEKTGLLEVQGEGLSGSIRFCRGLPHSARCDDGSRGASAIRRLLVLSGGTFVLSRLSPEDVGPREVSVSFTRLLMDHARESDESGASLDESHEDLPLVDRSPLATQEEVPATPETPTMAEALPDEDLVLSREGLLQAASAALASGRLLEGRRLRRRRTRREEQAAFSLLKHRAQRATGDPFVGCTLGSFEVTHLLDVQRGERRYLGQHQLTNDPVLLRVFPLFGPHAEEFGALAVRAKATLNVGAPQLEPCVGYGKTREAFYAAFPPPFGLTLREVLAEGPMTPEQVLALIGEVGLALQALHSRGLVHGQVCLDSIRLEPTGVLLCGAGLGRIAAAYAGLCDVEPILAAPGYASPELLDTGKTEPTSDMFALGVAAEAALTGVAPPAHLDAQAYLERALAPLRLEGVPEVVVRLVEKLRGPDPKRRYTDALELLSDFSALERGQVPTAFPPVPRRTPLPVASGGARKLLAPVAVVCLLLAVGLALSAYAAARVEVPDPLDGFRFRLPSAK